MIRVALKGMASRPLRTLLTTLAIVLGVGMVSAAFTLTDTMRGAANSLSSAAYDGTDAVVSARTAFKVDSPATTRSRSRRIAAAMLAEVRSVPQVGAAVGDISDQAQIIGRDGKPVGDGPYFGTGFDSTPRRRREADRLPPPGRPLGDRPGRGRHRRRHGGEAALRASATACGSPRAARPPRSEVVGVARFGTVKSLGTATTAVFDLATAQKLFHKQGRYDSILVAGRSGTPRPTSARAVAAAVGDSAQVQTAAAHDRFTLDGLKTFIGIIKTVLLVFGGVAILVGAFTIFNTLSITVAQRTREFAMLRMVGAARRQVLGSVMIEALALGLGASIIGLARGLRPGRRPQRDLRSAGPLRCPQAGTVFEARTAIVALSVGTLVTLAAGILPARRATKIAPVAALRDADPSARKLRLPSRARAGGGVAARPPGGRDRRLRRPARAPQRDAPPGPHGGHRQRADDRRDARDRGHRRGQRPPPGDQGHARRPHRGVARDHRAGRLVADGSGDRPHRGRGPRASPPSARCARTAASWPATRRSSTASTRATIAKVFDFEWKDGSNRVLTTLGDERRGRRRRLGVRARPRRSATRSRSPRRRASSSR